MVELSRETLEQVLECLPCAAFVWDEQHRVVAHNQLAALQVAIVPGEVLLPFVPEAPALLSVERRCWTTRLTSPAGRTLEVEFAARRISVEGRGMLLVSMFEQRAVACTQEDLSRSEVRLRQAVHVGARMGQEAEFIRYSNPDAHLADIDAESSHGGWR